MKNKKPDKWILLNFGSYFNFNKLFIKKIKIDYLIMPCLYQSIGRCLCYLGNDENEKNWGSRIQEIDEYTKDGGFIDNGYILDSIDYKINSDRKSCRFFEVYTKNDKKLLTRFLNKIKMQNLKKLQLTKERVFFPRLNTKKMR